MTFSRTAIVALLVVSALLVALCASAERADRSTTPLTDNFIRCKVCDRAIAHIWHQGVKLRTHCAVHSTDKRCDITNLHRSGVEEMVKEVCDELPQTHQALIDSEFELIAHEDPKHEPHQIEAIRNACIRWVHDEHTVDYVSRLIYANLDAGKSTQVILHKLQERFCDAACRKVEPQNADL
jgi:hypothetical protein